jgi:hypothetical protein
VNLHSDIALKKIEFIIWYPKVSLRVFFIENAMHSAVKLVDIVCLASVRFKETVPASDARTLYSHF